jgi:hypothetical protein
MLDSHIFSTAASELIIAADEGRDHITIQNHTANAPVFLGFGEVAQDAKGIKLIYPGCSVRVIGAKSRLAIYGIEPGDSGGVVGIETTEDVEYRPGSYAYGY